ncbi:MAG: diguanylate cyclase [Bacillota bacterium]
MNKRLFFLFLIFLLSINITFGSTDVDFSKIFQNHGLPRLIINADTGEILYANKAAIDFYKYPKEKLLNMEIQEINVLSAKEVAKERELAYKEERNFFHFQHKLANGEIKEVEVHSYPVIIEGERILYSVIIDITEKVLLEQKVDKKQQIIILLVSFLSILLLFFLIFINKIKNKYKKLAETDTLTGAYSRLFLKEIVTDFKKFKKENNYSLIQIDIDDFKKINDSYGHDVGDKVLQYFVKTIKDFIRKEDVVIRFGGDEFLVLLKSCKKSKAKEIVQRIKRYLLDNDKFDFEISFSYGIESVNDIDKIYKAIQKADRKMYNLKNKK